MKRVHLEGRVGVADERFGQGRRAIVSDVVARKRQRAVVARVVGSVRNYVNWWREGFNGTAAWSWWRAHGRRRPHPHRPCR
jgi:hypothetical protein